MAVVQQAIEKLDASNYASWVRDMNYLSIECDCWSIVTEEDKVLVIDEKGITAKDVKDFNLRARVGIYSNIQPEFKSMIRTCDTAVDAWKILKDHYQPDNQACHLQLFSELLACRIKSDESIDLFAAKIKRISEQLKDIKQEIPEIYLCFQLIRDLPDQFNLIVQSILRLKDQFVYKIIMHELIAKESQIQLQNLYKPDS